MPVYDYECSRCGPFTLMRPMAECEEPAGCPRCGRDSPRAFLTAPYFAAMVTERRMAFAANERSAHAPQRLSAGERRHRAGCSCCTAKPGGKRGGGSREVKGFPSRRPWMLSH